MKIFRRKRTEEPPSERWSFVTHVPSRDLALAEAFALMLAQSRHSDTVGVAEALGGLYIANFERLSRYWPDPEQAEDFMEIDCHIDRQRWRHWFEYSMQCYEHFRKPRLLNMIRLKAGRGYSFIGKYFSHSTDLRCAYTQAEQLTPFREQRPDKELPVITSETLLLAIAKLRDVEISMHLRESGLDLQGLEEAVRSPKRKPLR